MLLAINANNTNTVFAVWDGVSLTGVWRAATDGRRTADEYVVWLDHLLGLQNLSRRQIDGAVIASVVPEANFNLRRLCREYCRRDPLVVGAPGVAIVVDFGTATTFDVVDADGNYRGGVIAPGINLSLQALAMAAAKLPSVPIARTEKVIGTSTVACMQSGIFWGYVGLVEGLVDRIKREFSAPMDVVSTGGLAPLFDGATRVINHVDPDLTLWGLRLIYRRNSNQ
jgi:type III pantothenate kinase